MPGRTTPIITDQIYHVYNRGIDRRPTFTDKREYQRAIKTIKFYKFSKPPVRLSRFLRSDSQKQADILKLLKSIPQLIEIYCYCLMPNHFHFLIKQKVDNGIAKFLSNFQNSYTKYFNVKNSRDGSLFLDQFKAVRIETDEQFIHVSRYIHLNPHTGYVVKSFTDLEQYPWSSFKDYIMGKSDFVDMDFLMEFFKTSKKYKKFVQDQADYQRKLKEIEHLTIENP